MFNSIFFSFMNSLLTFLKAIAAGPSVVDALLEERKKMDIVIA